jgi:hypothetical protein
MSLPVYRYHPPKSSVWGHALRGMKPARQRALFQEFLRQAVAQYGSGEGSLGISAMQSPESAASAVERFERILGLKSYNGFFPKLSKAQIDLCFDELVADEALCAGQHLNLLEPVPVTHWSIDGTEVPTASQFMLYYGSLPTLGTSLRFNSVEEFQRIRDVLQAIKLCKLNEKHLRLDKRAPPSRRDHRSE